MEYKDSMKILSSVVAVLIVLSGFASCAYMTYKMTKSLTLNKIHDNCVSYHADKKVKEAKMICTDIVYFK